MKRASDLLSTNVRSISIDRNILTESTIGDLPYVQVLHNDENGITTLSMSKPPVNSINEEFAMELRKALETAVGTKSRGIILASSLPKTFSAGVDIKQLYKPDKEKLDKFWNSFQELWLTLYGLGIPIAAAINGASPAAGCLLCLSCEYRVMVEGEHTIGLNATELGIVPPKWFQNPMIRTVGYRQAELALTRGTLFKPQEALRIGLIDELAIDRNDAIAKCEKFISSFDTISSRARESLKLSMRRDDLDWLKKNRALDKTLFLEQIESPQVQETLQKYIESLKKRLKKGNASREVF